MFAIAKVEIVHGNSVLGLYGSSDLKNTSAYSAKALPRLYQVFNVTPDTYLINTGHRLTLGTIQCHPDI